MNTLPKLAAAALISFSASTAVLAADPEVTLTIRDHRFEPAELRVPAGRKIKLVIDNQDASAEEFESHALNREKVIPGKTRVPVFIGPLKPGRYPFEGEYNAKTAKGLVIAE
jgi:plastocyanin